MQFRCQFTHRRGSRGIRANTPQGHQDRQIPPTQSSLGSPSSQVSTRSAAQSDVSTAAGPPQASQRGGGNRSPRGHGGNSSPREQRGNYSPRGNGGFQQPRGRGGYKLSPHTTPQEDPELYYPGHNTRLNWREARNKAKNHNSPPHRLRRMPVLSQWDRDPESFRYRSAERGRSYSPGVVKVWYNNQEEYPFDLTPRKDFVYRDPSPRQTTPETNSHLTPRSEDRQARRHTPRGNFKAKAATVAAAAPTGGAGDWVSSIEHVAERRV